MASVLVGSSGVGKSTLCIFLIGVDAQKTSEVSSASRGKHTTTARSLLLPDGADWLSILQECRRSQSLAKSLRRVS